MCGHEEREEEDMAVIEMGFRENERKIFGLNIKPKPCGKLSDSIVFWSFKESAFLAPLKV